MPNLHHKLSPSAAHRWLACPGSLGYPAEDRTSQYAEEGTRAHELANRGLTADNDLWTADASDEMIEAVRVFIDHCRGLGPVDIDKSELFLESKMLADFGGTLDHLAIHDDTAHAWISDFKYGAGVPVAAEKNPQLLCYAVLVLENYPDVETFTLTIVQPRTAGEAVDSWTCDRKTVSAFRQKIIDTSNKTDLCPGDHCRWCPALTVCDALAAKTLEVAKLEFDDLNSRLLEIFRLAPAIKSLLDAVPGRMISAMQHGESFPGLKAVQAYGNRAWKYDDDEIIRRLGREKIGKKISTVAKLRSPTQLEKDGYGDVVAPLCERPERGIALVPEADKRPALVFDTPSEQFDDLSFLD
jgi:hypothetical protein